MLDGFSNLLSGACLGALDNRAAEKSRDAVILRSLTQESTPENGVNGDERQSMILMDEKAKPVGEFDFLCL